MTTKGARLMSGHERTFLSVLSTISYVGTNVLAWATSFDAGAVAASFTVVSLAGFAAYSKWIKLRGEKYAADTKLEADRVREMERAKAEAWAERTRLEMQVRVDQEKLEAGSLNSQIQSLQAAIEESNRAAVENRKRVEDANKKLHDMANERQTEVLRHHTELDMLMKQLELVTQQLEDSRAENRALMGKLEARVQANTGAIDRIALPSPESGDWLKD